MGLGSAIASSPLWRRLSPGAILGVRMGDRPRLTAVGCFDDADRFRLATLITQLQEAADRLRYVDWAAVEDSVDRLAVRLVDELGSAEVGRAGVVAVPRGGLVVAGLLAVRLGIAVEPSPPSVGCGPALLVDDVVLSGRRMSQMVSQLGSPDVVAVTLCSHPELRRAATQRWGLRAFVSADDLTDHAPSVHGSRYSEWRHRWRERQPDDLWTGQPEHVVFPWNEPESQFANEVTGELEPSWRLVPSELCLKNRPVPGEHLPVHEHQEGPGPVGAAPGVVALPFRGSTVVVPLTGQCVRLSVAGEVFWEQLMAAGSLDEAAKELSRRYGISAETVSNDVAAFAGDLADRGLICGLPQR